MAEAINQHKQMAMGKKLNGQKLAKGGAVAPVAVVKTTKVVPLKKGGKSCCK